MAITSHGALCDVCGSYILPNFDDSQRVHQFAIFGIPDLCCDNECKGRILALDTSKPLFWRDLPDGPVRQLAERIAIRDGIIPDPTCKQTLQVREAQS